MIAARRWRRALVAFLFAWDLRLAFVIWGWNFPPAGDGEYYDKLARRLASGSGYTWLWPDGAVTYAAHYPVGYPAIVALGYRVFGATPGVAMLENAALGALATAAVYLLARGDAEDVARERRAFFAALAFAIHPALLPYTIALMTEGPALSLLCVAVALTQMALLFTGDSRSSEKTSWLRRATTFRIVAAVVLGVTVLVRPQYLLMAPVLGAISVTTKRARITWSIAFTAIALLVCAPWTIRNCARMDRCALVSVNGGWNLLIGVETDNGSFTTLAAPDECKTVWSEAGKDECFGNAAKKAILRDPIAWISKAPKKLGVTLDYFGAAPWYLQASDDAQFPMRAKIVLGTIETVVTRALLAVACFAVGIRKRRGAARVVGALAILFALSRWGFVSYLLLAVVLALEGKRLCARSILAVTTLAVIAETCMMHAIFFGGGRYGLVTVPFVTALAFVVRSDLPAPQNAVKEASSTPSKRSPVFS